MSILPVLAPVVGAGLNRLRGGAFQTLTGLNIRTTATRVAFGAFFAVFIAISTHNYWNLVTAVTVFAGVACSGWGPFQGLGLAPPSKPEASWMRWLPLKLGFPVSTLKHDAVGLMEAGIVFMAPTAIWIGYAVKPLCGIECVAAGLLFPLAYGIPRVVPMPQITKFALGQAWGEVFTGAIMLTAFVLTAKGF